MAECKVDATVTCGTFAICGGAACAASTGFRCLVRVVHLRASLCFLVCVFLSLWSLSVFVCCLLLVRYESEGKVEN